MQNDNLAQKTPALHEVQWNSEKIQTFWNHIYTINSKNTEHCFFSQEIGKSLLSQVKKYININKKNILDYGCGTGFLLEYILNMSTSDVYGFDYSKTGVDITTKRLSNNPHFKGAKTVDGEGTGPIGYPDNSFDIIFVVEVIEHCDDDALNVLILECKRLLKQDGLLILTTPNNENLISRMTVCPDCGCQFHRVQHMRSFTKESLSEKMQDSFTTIKAITGFLSKNSIFNKMATLMRRIQYKLLKQEGPNLIWIGKVKK